VKWWWCITLACITVWPYIPAAQSVPLLVPAHVQAVQAAAAAAAQSHAVEQQRALQSSNSALREELATRSAALEGLVADRDEAAQRLAEAQAQLEAERHAAAAAKAAAAALERRLGDLSAQVRVGRANVNWLLLRGVSGHDRCLVCQLAKEP
jgi:DNA repair exonuclease SbcCD ATPase subunit